MRPAAPLDPQPQAHAADLIVKGMDGTITARPVTHNSERLIRAESDTGFTKVKCSEFGDAVIKHMG